MKRNVLRLAAIWIVLSGMLLGFVAAQFAIPTDYIHRRFPPGHFGFPGGFSTIKRVGWPMTVAVETIPNWDEPQHGWRWSALAIDIATLAVAISATAAALRRVQLRFGLAAILEVVTALAICLALSRLFRMPFGWPIALAIYSSLFCACATSVRLCSSAVRRIVGRCEVSQPS